MQVFVTGATGWIGSAVVGELLAAGYDVVGLARSEEAAAALGARGINVQRGSLDDPAGLRAAAERSDAVVHLAFNHDFDHFTEAGHTERAAVESLAAGLEGSDRPLLVASGVAGLAPGRVATEKDRPADGGPDAPRGASEAVALGWADRGVRSVALRFAPTVHGDGDHGFVSTLIDIARRQHASGFVADGTNRWPAVHRADAAGLVRLAVEGASAGSVVHAVAEEGIETREIAEAIGRHLEVPVRSIDPDDAADHFGWIGRFFSADVPTSSEATRRALGWAPTHPTLLDDLGSGSYFA